MVEMGAIAKYVVLALSGEPLKAPTPGRINVWSTKELLSH